MTWNNDAATKTSETIQSTIKAFGQEKMIVDYMAKGFIYIDEDKNPTTHRSALNRALTYAAGTRDGRTYKAWQEVGRQVKQGSKAFYIFKPLTGKRKEIDSNGREQEVQFVYGYGVQPEFRIEDTEIVNPALWQQNSYDYKPRTIPPLMEVAAKMGLKITYRNTTSGEYGATDGKQNIYLSTEDAPTFFHELVHAGQHAVFKNLKMGQDVEQETIAELGACVLAAMYGIDYKNFAWTYIAGYVKSTDPKKIAQACAKVADKVEQIIEFLLNLSEDKPALEKIAIAQ
jgi:hypothetical protein